MDKKKKIYVVVQLCITVLAIAIATIAISHLNNDRIFEYSIRDRLLEFTYQDEPADNYIHGNAFSSLLINVEDAMDSASINVLYVAIAALVISLIMRKFSDDIANVLYLSGIGAMTFAGISYLITMVFVGNGKTVDTTFLKIYLDGIIALIIFIILLIIGAGIVTSGVIEYRKREVNKLIKVLSLAIISMVGVMSAVMIILPLPKLNDKYKLAKDCREYVEAYREGTDEQIGYQIGNHTMGTDEYPASTGVYVDDKLYLAELKENKDENINAIYTLDAEGNYEKFFDNDSISNVDNLSYNNGYIYARCNINGEENHTLIRISINDASFEEVLSVEGTLCYGISGDGLYYGIVCEDDELIVNGNVYYVDLTKEDCLENSVIVDEHILLYDSWFLNQYVYNVDNAVPGATTMPYWYQIYDGVMYGLERSAHTEYRALEHDLCMYTYNEDVGEYNKGILIDEYVDRYNIYAGKIYYIKNVDLASYEIWSCDMDGNNKTLIGVLEPEISDDVKKHCCDNILVGDGYIVVDFRKYYEFLYDRYFINIEDGNSVILND